jgi:hypothetical protein
VTVRRRGRRWADRYDGYGAVAGVLTFLILGVVFTTALGQGDAGWLLAIAFGCGVMNVTSFVLRRTDERK